MVTNAEHKYPKRLFVFYFGEFWDRFNYYGIQSILVLYLVSKFLFSDNKSYLLYGVFTTLAFSTPIVGGIIADKIIGYQRSIIFGVLFIVVGNILLYLDQINILYLGLSLVILGIGLFKANNVSLFGLAHVRGSAKDTIKFTSFYLSMDVGSMVGPILYALVTYKYGWNSGFVLGAFGAFASFCMFMIKRRSLLEYDICRENGISICRQVIFCLIVITIISVLVLFFYFPMVFSNFIWVVVSLLLLSMLLFLWKKKEYRKSVTLLVILELFSMIYFTANVQIGSSLMLFIKRCVDTTVLGYKIPVALFASLEPFFVVLIALNTIVRQRKSKKNVGLEQIIKKIIFGVFCSGFGFIIFAFATRIPVVYGINYPLALVVVGNFLLGMGELLIGPSIISAITTLAPVRSQGFFMGSWCFFVAFAVYIGSLLAKVSSYNYVFGLSLSVIKAGYFNSFLATGIISLFVFILMRTIEPILRKLLYDK